MKKVAEQHIFTKCCKCNTFEVISDLVHDFVVNGQSIIDILYIYFITLYLMCYMLLHVLPKTFFLNILCQILIPYCMSF